MDPIQSSVDTVFIPHQEHLDGESVIREDLKTVVHVLDRTARLVECSMQQIHQSPANVEKACLAARQVFDEKIKPGYAELEGKIPQGEFFRFHDCWRFTTTKLTYVASLVYALEKWELADQQTVANMLGLKLKAENSAFFLETEDYLCGLLQTSKELTRYCVNCVTNGEYNQPMKVKKFITDLNNGFRLLNLKNEGYLRKRYDGLKYDMKKVEEVIYDMKVHGLGGNDAGQGQVAASQDGAP